MFDLTITAVSIIENSHLLIDNLNIIIRVLCVFLIFFCFWLRSDGKIKKGLFKIFLFLVIFVYGIVEWFLSFGPIPFTSKFFVSIHDIIVSFLTFQTVADWQNTEWHNFSFGYMFFHFLALFFIVYLSISFLAGRIANYLKFLYFSEKDLNVFWGSPNRHSILLAELSKGKKLFRLPYNISFKEEDSKLVIQQIESKKALWIFTSQGDYFYSKGYCHYFMDCDVMENVRLAGMLIKEIKSTELKKKKIFILACSSEEEKNLMEWANKQKVNIRILNNAKLLAHKFIEEYPIFEAPGITTEPGSALVKGAFNILIVGFGERGQENLKVIVCNSQFYSCPYEKVPLNITVLTDNAKKLEEYKEFFKDAIEEYDIRFDVVDFSFENLSKWYEANKVNPEKYNRIIICTDDDEKNLSIGRYFDIIKKNNLHIFDEKTIFLEIEDSEIFDQYENKFQKARLTLFGDIRKVYKYVVLMDDRIEKLAKMLAFKWDKPNENMDIAAIDKHWAGKDFFKRESNRFSAMGQYNYLRLLGYDVYTPEMLYKKLLLRDRLKNHGQFIGNKIITPEIMEILARINHERWKAYHYMQGIKKWNLINPLPKKALEICRSLGKEGEITWNLIAYLNMHAGMCSFDELPHVELELYKANGNGQEEKKEADFTSCATDWQTNGKARQNNQAKTYSFISLIDQENYSKAGIYIIKKEQNH